MIRKISQQDKDVFIAMARDFYSSDAVLHNIPDRHLRKTFDLITSDSPYGAGYIIEYKQQVVGYALISLTYSNEAGGLVLWIEEIYVLPTFQGMGLARSLMDYIENEYKNKVARIRLELNSSNSKAGKIYQKLGFAELPYEQMYKEYA